MSSIEEDLLKEIPEFKDNLQETPEPPREDSRKRPAEEGADTGDRGNKRANSTATTGVIKVLVSSDAAGTIIGKGGETVSALQARTGARVKLSQNRDFFPGTRNRTVLIQGDREPLTKAVHFVVECHNSQHKEGVPDPDPDQSRGEAILSVASNAAGLILGRGGENIKDMQAASGAHIHITSKEEAVAGERVVTITGNLQQIGTALDLVIDRMHEDLEQCTYQNTTTTYSFSHPGPPGARGRHPAPPMHMGGYAQAYQGYGAGAYGSSGYGYGAGYDAYGAQQQYGQQPYAAQYAAQQPAAGYGAMPAAAAQGYGAAGQESVAMAVPDYHVGQLVGKGGSIIRDFQMRSGARIQISQKGDFIPGTTNRAITVSGNPQAVQMAQYLVSQKLQEIAQLASVVHNYK